MTTTTEQPTVLVHGEVITYRRGCTCSDCRLAMARYEKHRVWDLAHGKPRMVDPLGSRRRVQALMALGWSYTAIGAHSGHAATNLRNLIQRRNIKTTSADRIAAAYDALSMTLPPGNTPGELGAAARSRNMARRNGWPPPLAWDNIDDPNEQPDTLGIRVTDSDPEPIDQVVVERILNSHVVPATRAERLAVIERWRDLGRPLSILEDFTGWNIHRDLRRAAQAEPAAA